MKLKLENCIILMLLIKSGQIGSLNALQVLFLLLVLML